MIRKRVCRRNGSSTSVRLHTICIIQTSSGWEVIPAIFTVRLAIVPRPTFLLVDRLDLPTIDPAGNQRQEELQRLACEKHPTSVPGHNTWSVERGPPRRQFSVRIIGLRPSPVRRAKSIGHVAAE